MTDELKSFLILLYEPEDIIELRLIWDPKEDREDKRKNKNLKIYKHWFTLNELLQSIDYLKGRNEEEYNIFFGVNPRKESRTSGDNNVKFCRCFFADFDDVEEDATADTIEKIISDKGIALPTLIVQSGHGFHVYWLLSKKLSPKKWSKPQTDLVAILKADSRTKNLERILRLPGFLNVKKKPFPECKIVKINESNIYNTDVFVRTIKPAKTKEDVHREKTSSKWYDFNKLNIPLLLEENNVITSNQDKDNVYISCIFPEFDHKGEASSHRGDDSTPSMSIGISDKHCGDVHCFGCGVKCTILEILLYFSDKNIFSRKQKNVLWRRRHELILKLNERFPGFYILPPCSIYKANYPADIAEEIAKKYFSISEKDPEAGLIHLFYFEAKFYVKKKDKEVYSPLQSFLNPLLWHELKDSKRPGNCLEKFEPQPFPVNQSIVNNVIDALKAVRDIGFKKKQDLLDNIFWIYTDRHGLPNPKDLIVVSNRTINFKTFETYANTPNLFCTTSLPVRYDPKLPQPRLCDKILKENLETEEQILEHYKRDAYLCRPFVDRTALFISIGRTGSGKGLDIHFTKSWLGRFNWVESSLNQMGEKFGLQNWPGTLAAFISEIDEDSVNRTEKGLAVERLKRIAAGDYVNIRIPGGEWFDTRLATKVVIATTMMPTFPRSMEEMSRRIHVMEFKKQYAERSILFPEADKSPDENLLDKMLEEKDAYFTHRVMKIGMPALLSEGLKHTEEHSVIMSESVSAVSLYARFWDETTENNPEGRIKSSDMIKVFISWCHINNYMYEMKGINVLRLSKGIRQVRKLQVKRYGHNNVPFWIGRNLTKFGKTLLDQYERVWRNSEGADMDSPF